MNFSFLSSIGLANLSSNELVQHFSPNINVSASDSLFPQHVEPTLAIGSNNQLFAGWKEASTSTGPGVDVSFTSSSDNGITWTAPLRMPYNVSSSWSKSDPWLNYFNKTIYFTYLEYNTVQTLGSNSQVTMARSTDNGTTWITTKATQNKLFADKETFIISLNGTIYLTYDDIDLNSNLGLVILAKSIDNGNSFSDITSLNNSTADDIVAPYPALSSNNTLFVAWAMFNDSNNYFGDVYYDHSVNGGENFTKNSALNPQESYAWYNNYKATIPVMKFDSKDRLYILWSEYTNYSYWKVYLRYSDDYGEHWSNKISIDDTPKTNQWEPDMAIDSHNNLHIAWLEESNNQYRPYYREISFYGSNYSSINKSTIIPIADAYTSSNFLRPGDYLTIRIDSKDVSHVVWTDGRTGSLNIYYSYSENNSNTNTSSSKVSPGFTVIFVIALIPSVLFVKKLKIKLP